MRILSSLCGLLLLSGCQGMDPLSGERDPHSRWWRLGFTAPDYMSVWVETADVVDMDGKRFRRVSSGLVSGGMPEDGSESARGWNRLGANDMPAVGAAWPRRIFVRWQSIVEPQTYRAWVDIPEEARELLQRSIARRCPHSPERPANYYASLMLGLAPGGMVQVWVWDECARPLKVARAQGEVEPLGPDQGLNEGRYVYPISEKSRRYIERFGIPYGSW